MPLKMQNPEVEKDYEINPELDKDFQIRVPQKQWSGMFTEITPEIAEQLVKEKYNHIKPKVKK